MNRLEKEMAYVEKEELDKAETMREGKKILSVWLMFRIRTLRKAGWPEKTILDDIEFEVRKVLG